MGRIGLAEIQKNGGNANELNIYKNADAKRAEAKLQKQFVGGL